MYPRLPQKLKFLPLRPHLPYARSGRASFQELWERIYECCCQDLDHVSAKPPVLVAQTRHYKTWITVFHIDSENGGRRYIAKLPVVDTAMDDWDPGHEFEALATLRAASKDAKNWQVPFPVGYSSDPRFLVTRYVAGTCMRALTYPGMRIWAGRQWSSHSLNLFRKAGECLIEMRAATARRSSDVAAPAPSIMEFCDDRLREIETLYPFADGPALCRRLRGQLQDLLSTDNDALNLLLEHSNACHGEFSPQNILICDQEPTTLVDLEGFRFAQLNEDLARFRFRLEHLSLRVSFSNELLLKCWGEFYQLFTTTEAAGLHSVISYLYKLLAHLAWMGKRSSVRSQPVRTRMRDWLWVRNRLKWLRQFSVAQSPRQMQQILRDHL